MNTTCGPYDPDRRLHLDLAVQVEPVQGQLVDQDGRARTFVGWLELVELIEEHRSGREPE